MENQTSFAQAESVCKKKQTRRERILGEMEGLVPWARSMAWIAPLYRKVAPDYPLTGIEKILRVYILQQWCSLVDEALEDVLHDSKALRSFVGIDLRGGEAVPNAKILLHFHHLFEKHALIPTIFAKVNALLCERGILSHKGMLVDATIIAAPASTKSKAKECDRQMHQAREGKRWYLSRKARFGVDTDSGVVHTLTGTAANVADIARERRRLHWQEKRGQSNSGCTGVEKRVQIQLVPAGGVAGGAQTRQDQGHGRAAMQGSRQPWRRRRLNCVPESNTLSMSSKTVFVIAGFCYRGLAKNTIQFHSLFFLADSVNA